MAEERESKKMETMDVEKKWMLCENMAVGYNRVHESWNKRKRSAWCADEIRSAWCADEMRISEYKL